MPSKAVGENGLRTTTQQKKSDPLSEEPPEGGQWFVEFETIVLVGDRIQDHESQQPKAIHCPQITTRPKKQPQQTIRPQMHQVKK